MSLERQLTQDTSDVLVWVLIAASNNTQLHGC
jgi:hypothetical protein